ncbi:hypothetical protein BV898_07827 [Hypsibius exemplaris]|uniref:Uncharacterized protein n=1 Tax=Hypsibius exemplaris TaxID=2072580 RepID=A0A1W0WS79_HYPEX|nr:hypothetical protein BV898_07827 [Hypsibius exemplaris]
MKPQTLNSRKRLFFPEDELDPSSSAATSAGAKSGRHVGAEDSGKCNGWKTANTVEDTDMEIFDGEQRPALQMIEGSAMANLIIVPLELFDWSQSHKQKLREFFDDQKRRRFAGTK